MSDSTPLPSMVFVGRDEALGAFRRLLEVEASEGVPLLAFHGPAGIGKSTLMRALYHSLQNVAPPAPHAWFNARNIVNHPQAYREVLMSWRVTLQDKFALRFPRFDLCFALLLAQEGRDDSAFFEWLPSLKPTYELCKFLLEAPSQAGQLMNEMNEAGQAGSNIGAAYWMQNGENGQPLINSLCCRVLSDEASVIPELISYFIADLKDSLWGRDSYGVRAVLFFDSLEALWPSESPLLPELNLYAEWWLREVAALCMASGILLVIGTREALNWSENDPDWQGAHIEQYPVLELTPREAQEFLARCGIGPSHPEAPSSLQRAIMRSCSSVPAGGLLNQWTNRQVGDSLPLWLALSADIIQNFRRNGKGEPGAAQFALVQSGAPGKKLCDLLLKSLDDRDAARWLRELGLTPRCDFTAAQAIMGAAESNSALLLHWKRFTEYSFVEDQGDGFWRIEPSLRRHLNESIRRDDSLAAHLNFFHHWTDRGQSALAWFHQWALNPREATEQWRASFDAEWEANTPENMVHARELLGWWGEIALDENDLELSGPKTWAKAHATLALALHDTPFRVRATALALSITHYEASLLVFTSDEFPREWAETQIHMGRVQRALAREQVCTDKQALLRAAIERYQMALRVATPTAAPREWGEIQMQMAGAHRDLLELDAGGPGPHNHLERSIHFYEEAMRLWARARHPREWARIQVEMAATYAASPSGGRVRNLERALSSYSSALEIFTEADAPREWADVNIKMATALMELPFGDRTENVKNALTHYLSALRVYDEAVTPFLWTQTHLDVGLAWGELAYASDDRNAYRNAINYITTAGQSFARLGRADEAARCESIVQDINESLQRGM